jgi:hypothetical protein
VNIKLLLQTDPLSAQPDAINYADQCHVDRVIPVKELSQPPSFSPLTVVKRQQRDREPASQMENTVDMTVHDEERDNIQRRKKASARASAHESYLCFAPSSELPEVPQNSSPM